MFNQTANTLINPQTGNLAFKIFFFENASLFNQVQRLNYYSIIWLKEGNGKLKVDFSEYDIESNLLFAFAPYQPFVFNSNGQFNGVVLNFHPDFFCIHKHHQEVACNGILFNNIYQPPFVKLEHDSINTINMLMEQMVNEIQNPALAQFELIVSYLKIFLINASRLKANQHPNHANFQTENKEIFILQNLKNYIEMHFKSKHSASNYADLLNITPKALTKITKTHFNKTLTNLISERIIIEAKRELYLSNKAIKEIAYELGYDDEHYFSRFFKNNANISPQLYRDTVGFARAGG